MTHRSLAASGAAATNRLPARKHGKQFLLFAGTAFVLLSSSASNVDAADERKGASSMNRVVVMELFTSQGCSSCPSADRVLSKLGREKFREGSVIPLAFHVDYWNRIGWTDPFSSSRWSQRQSAYAAARRSTQVYTPQLVLNGRAELVGSEESRIRKEISRQLDTALPGAVTIRRITVSGNDLKVDVEASLANSPGANMNVYVVLFENGVTTEVTRGENSGRRLTNDYIVRSLSEGFAIRSGEAPTSRSLTIPLNSAWRRSNLGVAAFIQDSRSLSISGATAQPVASR